MGLLDMVAAVERGLFRSRSRHDRMENLQMYVE